MNFLYCLQTINASARQTIANACSPQVAKQLGCDLHLRPDWDEVKISVMDKCLREKFRLGSILANSLIQTGNEELIKGNFHHDQFFGSCLCDKHKAIPGRNELGKLLMSIRKGLRPKKEISNHNNSSVFQNLNIVSWNVQDLISVTSKGKWENFVQLSPDIICLQGLNCEYSEIPDEVYESDYPFIFVSPLSDDSLCGVAILSRFKPTSITFGIKNDFTDSIVTLNFENFILINVHAPYAGKKLHSLDYKLDWLRALRKHVEKLIAKTVYICGDFDLAHTELDHKGPEGDHKAGVTRAERSSFSKLLDIGLVDAYRFLNPDSQEFSYWSQGPHWNCNPDGSRFDYVLIPKSTATDLKSCEMIPDIFGSEHCPIKFSFHTKLSYSERYVESSGKFEVVHQKGDVLGSPIDSVLAHAISEDLALSAGFARTIQKLFKVRDLIDAQSHHVGLAVCTKSKDRIIYNLVTKRKYNHLPDDVDVEDALVNLKIQMHKRGHWFLSIPEICCSLDKMNLDDILKLIETVFRKSGIRVTMYHL